MDNDTIIKLATIIAGLLTTIFGTWITYKMKQVERTQAKIEKTAVDTHKLVNYQSMLLARQHEVTARSLARITGDPEDIKEAENATRLREESEAKQASLQN